jgi:hypothetical protein
MLRFRVRGFPGTGHQCRIVVNAGGLTRLVHISVRFFPFSEPTYSGGGPHRVPHPRGGKRRFWSTARSPGLWPRTSRGLACPRGLAPGLAGARSCGRPAIPEPGPRGRAGVRGC